MIGTVLVPRNTDAVGLHVHVSTLLIHSCRCTLATSCDISSKVIFQINISLAVVLVSERKRRKVAAISQARPRYTWQRRPSFISFSGLFRHFAEHHRLYSIKVYSRCRSFAQRLCLSSSSNFRLALKSVLGIGANHF